LLIFSTYMCIKYRNEYYNSAILFKKSTQKQP